MRSCWGCLRRGGCCRRWARLISGCMGLRVDGNHEMHESNFVLTQSSREDLVFEGDGFLRSKRHVLFERWLQCRIA